MSEQQTEGDNFEARIKKVVTKMPKVIFNSAHMSFLEDLKSNVHFTYTKAQIRSILGNAQLNKIPDPISSLIWFDLSIYSQFSSLRVPKKKKVSQDRSLTEQFSQTDFFGIQEREMGLRKATLTCLSSELQEDVSPANLNINPQSFKKSIVPSIENLAVLSPESDKRTYESSSEDSAALDTNLPLMRHKRSSSKKISQDRSQHSKKKTFNGQDSTKSELLTNKNRSQLSSRRFESKESVEGEHLEIKAEQTLQYMTPLQQNKNKNLRQMNEVLFKYLENTAQVSSEQNPISNGSSFFTKSKKSGKKSIGGGLGFKFRAKERKRKSIFLQ